MLNLYKKY